MGSNFTANDDNEDYEEYSYYDDYSEYYNDDTYDNSSDAQYKQCIHQKQKSKNDIDNNEEQILKKVMKNWYKIHHLLMNLHNKANDI